jgi:hypothetical protein
MCRQTTVEEIEVQLEALRVELAETKGRLANTPSTFQVLSWFVGVAATLISITFTIARVI